MRTVLSLHSLQEDWDARRRDIVVGFQAAAGPLPPMSGPGVPALDVQVAESWTLPGGVVRHSISFNAALPGDGRVPAFVFVPPTVSRRCPRAAAVHRACASWSHRAFNDG